MKFYALKADLDVVGKKFGLVGEPDKKPKAQPQQEKKGGPKRLQTCHTVLFLYRSTFIKSRTTNVPTTLTPAGPRQPHAKSGDLTEGKSTITA